MRRRSLALAGGAPRPDGLTAGQNEASRGHRKRNECGTGPLAGGGPIAVGRSVPSFGPTPILHFEHSQPSAAPKRTYSDGPLPAFAATKPLRRRVDPNRPPLPVKQHQHLARIEHGYMPAAARHFDIIAMPAEVVDGVETLAGHRRWIGVA